MGMAENEKQKRYVLLTLIENNMTTSRQFPVLGN